MFIHSKRAVMEGVGPRLAAKFLLSYNDVLKQTYSP